MEESMVAVGRGRKPDTDQPCQINMPKWPIAGKIAFPPCHTRNGQAKLAGKKKLAQITLNVRLSLAATRIEPEKTLT